MLLSRRYPLWIGHQQKEFMKKNILHRIYPIPLHKDPKRFASRIGLASLSFITPFIDLITIPWEYYKGHLKVNKDKDLIFFLEDHLSIIDNEETRKFYFNDLDSIKFYFNNNSNEFHSEGETLTYSNLVFGYNQTQVQFYFDNDDQTLNKVLKFLYDQGVQFKEYRNGQRTFLLKQPKYKELQKIKKRYNLVW